MEGNSINDQNEYPVLRLNQEDPTGLHKFYEAQSLVDDKFVFHEISWLVHHVCTDVRCSGGLPGHSLIVVEGLLKPSNNRLNAQPRVFVGYYHLIRPYDLMDQKQSIYHVKKSQHDHHHLKKYYVSAKTWRVNKIAAQRMIDKIHAGTRVPYNFAGLHSLFYGDGKSHNCTTWAMEQLKNAGIEDPIKLMDNIKAKPKNHADEKTSCILL